MSSHTTSAPVSLMQSSALNWNSVVNLLFFQLYHPSVLEFGAPVQVLN